MQEFRPGLWHWAAPHPEWTPEDDLAERRWGPEVSCYAFSLGDHLVLIDPVIPETGLDELPGAREAVTVLTCPWHARDALKLKLPIYAPSSEAERIDSPLAVDYTAGETERFSLRSTRLVAPAPRVANRARPADPRLACRPGGVRTRSGMTRHR